MEDILIAHGNSGSLPGLLETDLTGLNGMMQNMIWNVEMPSYLLKRAIVWVKFPM